MNSVVLVGRLTKDPEVRRGNSSTVANFTLAINRGKKDGKDLGADFVPCAAFGRTAETIEQYVKKGQQLCVQGRVHTGSYEKDGKKVYTTNIAVDRIDFCGSLSGNSSRNASSEPNNPFDSFIPIDDSEVPF